MKTRPLSASQATLAAIVGVCALLLGSCHGSGDDSPPVPVPPVPGPPGPPVNGPAWNGYGRDPQHTAVGAIQTKPMQRVLWSTPIDLVPTHTSGGALLAHYGSPVISKTNTMVIPVKGTQQGGFRLEARMGYNGAIVWLTATDYVLPAHNWIPPYNIVLTETNRVYAPGAGGKLYYRDNVDSASGTMQTVVFYGASTYNAAPGTYDSTVFINTPLTVDPQGNVYFGFMVTGANPANLQSGIARIAADGTGTWAAASVIAQDANIGKVAMNAAPALSRDLSLLYVVVNTTPPSGSFRSGYLLALNSLTLAPQARIALMDPESNTLARISDDSTASPTIGPDGDVFYGVLENPQGSHNQRGWLLHFDSTLSQTKTPGSFGWDDTASIVPATLVPSYSGTSTYLLLTKYNNYYGTATGNGLNAIAILDPFASQTDSVGSGIAVMKEIMTKIGPTRDPSTPAGYTEWCINTAAVDPFTRSVLVNNEDGVLYRWDLTNNTFSESIRLSNGILEAYTPTIIGPDGVVYAMSDAVLFAVGN